MSELQSLGTFMGSAFQRIDANLEALTAILQNGVQCHCNCSSGSEGGGSSESTPIPIVWGTVIRDESRTPVYRTVLVPKSDEFAYISAGYITAGGTIDSLTSSVKRRAECAAYSEDSNYFGFGLSIGTNVIVEFAITFDSSMRVMKMYIWIDETCISFHADN